MTRSYTSILVLIAVVLAGLLTPERGDAQDPDYTLDSLLASVGARASSLARAGRSIQIIDREQIRATPAKSLIDLLRWANGVDLRDRSPVQADLSIRGAGFEEVLVLVNGVRRSDAQTGHFDLDLTIPIDRIERIEILRGPASALYGGDAVGGVINVITRESGSGWGARAEGGSFGSGAASLIGAGRAAGWSLQGGAEFSRSDGDRTKLGGDLAGTDYEAFVVDGSASRTVGSGRVVLEGGYARRDFGAGGFYAPIPAYEETRTLNGALRWSGELGADLGIQTRLNARRHEDMFVFFRDEPERGANTHDAHELGVESVVRWAPGGVLALAAGGEVYEEVLESSNLGARSQTRGALFMEAGLESAERRAALTLGLRADGHDAYSSSRPAPPSTAPSGRRHGLSGSTPTASTRLRRRSTRRRRGPPSSGWISNRMIGGRDRSQSSAARLRISSTGPSRIRPYRR
jgi:iron complex outermembrane receptor protein